MSKSKYLFHVHQLTRQNRTEHNFIMKFTLRPLAGGIREKQIYQKS